MTDYTPEEIEKIARELVGEPIADSDKYIAAAQARQRLTDYPRLKQERDDLLVMLKLVVRYQNPNTIKNAEDLLERIDRD